MPAGSSLNSEQQKAVYHLRGPLMILAGAGTGKTRVITTRILHMLAQGIAPQNIVALTFTNKAAREMSERITSARGSGAKKVLVSTFHSFCLKIYRQYIGDPELASFGLADTSAQMELLRKSLEEKGWTGLYKPEEILSSISKAKNLLITPELLNSSAALKLNLAADNLSILAALYPLYERQLALHRCIDFDDCLLKFIELLHYNQDARKDIQNQFQYVMVDEFQDTNLIQLEALKLLASEHQNVCVVGDDDQSIYSWRGADPQILIKYRDFFEGTKVYKLQQNYRCSQNILHAANHLIKNNSARMEKELWCDRPGNHSIILKPHGTEADEANWIANTCFGLLSKGFKLSDIGILYRTNGQAKAVELALRERKLQYKVFGGSSFFERKEIQDFLAYLCLTFRPHDRLAFWRIINTPSRGIGLKSQELIEIYARKHDVSPAQAALRVRNQLNGATRAHLDELLFHLTEIQKMPAKNPEDIQERGKAILTSFKLEADIRAKTKNEATKIKKIELLKSMPEWLKEVAEAHIEPEGLELQSMLDQLTLRDDPSKKSEKRELPAISLMTIHSSKGLEFPVVFLAGLEENLLPHKNSTSHREIEEERRLFYVAITRAKERLYMSYAHQRGSGFYKRTCEPSRFIHELPEKGIEMLQSDTESKSSGAQKCDNIKRLGALKDMIKKGFH